MRRNNCPGSCRVAERGQAMTEFLVACLVLIPVFLAIPLLGKYMDINHSAVQGARYVAWERTVWTPGKKSNTYLENEVRNRVFTRPGEPLRSGDANGPPAQYNPLWTDPAGKPMLTSYSDVTGHTETGTGQTTPGLIYNKVTSTLIDAFNTVMGWMEAIGGAHQSAFQINVHGMYSSTLGVNVAEQGKAGTGTDGMIPSLLHVAPLAIKPRPNVIVTDAWGVSGTGTGHHCTSGQDPMSELCQVAPLVTTTALSGWFSKLTHAVGTIIPEFKGLDYGRIEPGLAPEDRTPKVPKP